MKSTSAGLLVDDKNQDDDTVAGQATPFAEHRVDDFAGAGAIDQDPARGNRLASPRARGIETETVAIFQHEHRCAATGDSLRDARVTHQIPVLTVYRHEVARSDQGEHQFQLFDAPMARHVNRSVTLVNDFGPPTGDVVHQAPYGPLVARYGAGREHDHILRLQLDVTMVVHGDPGERGKRLTL